MANFVLVHGGDRDGSIWSETAKYLTQQGHQLICPSMTSVTKATLDQNIDEITSAINSSGFNKCILVGHSYGGFVITGVTNKIPGIIEALIYVDALIPRDGESLYDRANYFNFNYKEHQLTLDPAVMSKIHFDPFVFQDRPTAYIHCQQSEFVDLIKPMYQEAKAEHPDWLFFILDAKHACMFTHAKELAVLFSGMSEYGGREL